jgi:hypothetical protein
MEPTILQTRLEAPLADVAASACDFLRASAAALRERRAPPPLAAFEAALDRYGTTIAALRREGLTRGLRGDEAERFFALGFALEQMR